MTSNLEIEKKRIILVDDDPIFLESLQEILNQAGYSSLIYLSGKDALDVLSTTQEKFFALVTDFYMPQMNGLELIHKIQELKYAVGFFVIISGRIDQALKVESTLVGDQSNISIYFIDKLSTNKLLLNLLKDKIEGKDFSLPQGG